MKLLAPIVGLSMFFGQNVTGMNATFLEGKSTCNFDYTLCLLHTISVMCSANVEENGKKSKFTSNPIENFGKPRGRSFPSSGAGRHKAFLGREKIGYHKNWQQRGRHK